DAEITRLDASWAEARGRAETAEHEVKALQARLADAERASRASENERAAAEQAHAEAKVSLAQLEERLAAHRGRHEQFAADLHASDLRHRRDALAQRLREDCQIELEEEYQRVRQARSASEGDTSSLACASRLSDIALDDAEAEIDDLRKKLVRLGSVNLDSLQELAELERRDDAWRVQYDDLTAAQKHLMEIITTINEDSRRLFTETFAL